MRIVELRPVLFILLCGAAAAATAQTRECRQGAELELKLAAARADHGDDSADVQSLARRIRELQRSLLADHPDKTLEEICGTAQTAEAAPPRNDPNEVICRKEAVTGSHRRREVCMTRAEREANRRDTQREMRERRSLDP